MTKRNAVLPAVIKVAIVDDQQLFRSGIISLLKDFKEISVVIQAGNGRELLDQMKRHTPHVVLLDLEMPGMNGVETTETLREKYPQVKIVILTMHNEDELIFDLMTKGAHGFLPKDKSVEEVVDAIYAVMENGVYHSKQVSEAMINGSRGLLRTAFLNKSALNAREIEIIKLVCQEKTNKEIGESLGISPRTIENYKANILVKTGSKNNAGLVMYAIKNKLINRADLL